MEKVHIKLDGSSRIFFTSDLHIGHRNVIGFCDRPWANDKDMGKGLAAAWNSRVSNNDIIFVLGDLFWFNGRHETAKALRNLNGKDIYIVLGNHDTAHQYELALQDPRIHVLGDAATLWLEDESEAGYLGSLGKKTCEIFLCHYPLLTWPHRDHGAIQLFGHIHSGPRRDRNNMDMDLRLRHFQMDVGVDSRDDYAPWSLEEILTMMCWPDGPKDSTYLSGGGHPADKARYMKE